MGMAMGGDDPARVEEEWQKDVKLRTPAVADRIQRVECRRIFPNGRSDWSR